MLILDKILASFAYPLGLALTGVLLSLLAMLWGARRRGIAAALICAGLLWAASTPLVADAMVASLERQYPPQTAEQAPAADVIIVLGGGLRPADAFNPYPDLAEGADRVFHALRLHNVGKAPKLLLVGGQAFDGDAAQSEAEAMRQLLAGFGVAPEAMLIESKSRNTFENADFSSEIWRREAFKAGLLVTSALHMPRALAVFRRAGINVYPSATDAISGGPAPPMALRLLPSSTSLDVTTRALKEWIGYYVYSARN